MAGDSSAAMTAAIRRSGRSGVHMGAELQVLLIAVLFVVAADVGVRCITTANAQAPAPQPDPEVQSFIVFDDHEADVLRAILKNWTSGGLNKQLVSILDWSPQQHPCNNASADFQSPAKFFEGAWRGVYCTAVGQTANDTGKYYYVSVIYLALYGSNSTCEQTYADYSDQCGFDGIHGVLPSEIGELKNLEILLIEASPNLTGTVPLQIWQLPKLTEILFYNNSLEGTLPLNGFGNSSKLKRIDLRYNHFTGMLGGGTGGFFFGSSLLDLYLTSNNFSGTFPLDPYFNPEVLDLSNNNFNGTFTVGPYFSPTKLDLSNNQFSGTFSAGPNFNPETLYLTNNSFTSMEFSNYSGNASRKGLDTVYMPSLEYLYVGSNKLRGLFPKEILLMPSLQNLHLYKNYLAGPFPVEVITNLSSIDVSENNFSGSLDFRHVIPTPRYYQSTLNFSWNHFDGNFSSGRYLNPWTLDVSHNFFNHFNFDIYNGTLDACMPALDYLYMENNNGSGVFPIHILKAPILKALSADQNQFNALHLPDVKFENFSLSTGIILTNNKIANIEYQSKGGSPSPFSENNLQFSNYLFLAGNPLCENVDTLLLSAICRMNQSEARPPLNVGQSSSTKIKTIISTSTSTAGLILFLVSIYVWRLMRRIRSLGVILKEFDKREVKPNLYSYKDIKIATNNFDKRNKLGEGGFGVVYKGILSDGTIVAVKKLTMSSSQILSEFLNEVVVISGLIHRNLVKLKGCCLGDGDQRILVFEYVENKNLAEALSLSDDIEETPEPIYLEWSSRFNIIVGIARGLAFLHEDLQLPIIHRDIKATNILLDKDYNAKIADFGLAYLFPTPKNNASHLTMVQVAGTRGYLAPEYAQHGHMSTALDVYSFGVLVLEIICGRKNIDLQKFGDEVILQDWALKMFEEENSYGLIDPRMNHSSLDVEAIMRVISVALACVQFKAATRPKMHEVGHMLVGNMPVNKFHKHLGDVALGLNKRSDASSSWKNDSGSTEELSLIRNYPHDIEMSGRS